MLTLLLALTGVVCVIVAAFFYLKKDAQPTQPDYSYIIFKEYHNTQPIAPQPAPALEVTQPVENQNLIEAEPLQPEPALQARLAAILNFEE